MRRTQRYRPRRPFLGRTAAILAFLAQLAIVVAGIGEGRAGLGYAAHFDPGGTSTHYAHNEAQCASCQARSVHGLARPQHPPVVSARPRELPAVTWLESYLDSSIDRQNLSRAPPFVS
jgi:hypothetical protein